jgi:hypothetical protein
MFDSGTDLTQKDWDLFALGRWASGAENKLHDSGIFDISMHTQFKMMEEYPTLKEAWQQYCVLLHLCYNQQNKDTK